MAKAPASGALQCRRKFLRYFHDGFRDATYIDWERDYKWTAHQRWAELLGRNEFARLLRAGRHDEISRRAVSIESRTNLLFSFEKMALRDAVRDAGGARAFATGLFEFLHGTSRRQASFDRWCDVVAGLPRRQTRVFTWPLVTVFGFIAQPDTHIFLKPTVTKTAARAYGFPFEYTARPQWRTYTSLLAFAEQVRVDQRDLHPRDMIDLQSFIWVLGSYEYD